MKNIKLKNDKNLYIREAKVEDSQQLIDYVNSIAGESEFLTFGPGEFGITVEREKDIIKSYIEEKNKIYLVALIDNQIKGSINFSGGGRGRTEHTGEFGISVSREYWGFGIGKELLSYLLEWAKKTKMIRKINLRVRSDNDRGIRLYTNLGFEKEGLITRDFYINGKFYDSIQMGIKID
ncbi:GNAT family N-acetyltransferase [Sporosalibacterium faouarense]|uniref:GNAT family N-acetyltransferase n=1 Tax=Sporosalibacterium faouarense TaxID=516123 RepID=UPI00141D52EC|nr:GNAT family protein [Sporosalibacterium faouarense]MTI49262.1 GNAT family N-acetyltransferase [Bacillota bacterium]